MPVVARDDLTLAQVTEVAYVRRYYKLVPGTASAPAAPTTVPPAAETGWVTTEPGYTAGSSDVLYTVDVTVLTDGMFDYTPVSKSSAYEAARQAYNLANTANENATTGPVVLSRLVAGQATMGDLVTQTLAARIAAFIELSAESIVSGKIDVGRLNAQEVAAAVASFLQLNVSQLIATTATIDLAVVDKLWAEVVRSRKIVADMLLVGQGRNLAIDPNFANPVAWATPTHIQTTGGKYAPGSLLIPSSSTTVTSYAGTQPEYLIPVHPGERYRVAALFKPGVSVTAANRFSIGVRYRTAAGGTTALTTVVQNAGAVAANAEHELSGVITVPANATHMAIGFTKASTLVGTLRVMDYSIASMADSATIVDGSVFARHVDVADLVASTAFIQALTTSSIVTDSLVGKLITSATFRTAATGARWELGPNAISDGVPTIIGYIDSQGGGIAIADIQAGPNGPVIKARSYETAGVTFEGGFVQQGTQGTPGARRLASRIIPGNTTWREQVWAGGTPAQGGDWLTIDTDWQNITLLSGWSAVAGWPQPQWRIFRGRVEVRGRINGTSAAGPTMFRLPIEGRPLPFGDVIVLPADSGAYTRVAVYTRDPNNVAGNIDGSVFVAGKTGAINALSLDGMPLWNIVP